MNNTFKFKQFEVDQTGCAMKINTDGVLLAALVEAACPEHILDIGTGTGVLALMMAQRFENAQVEAVEIDQQASLTATKNFNSSKFKNRLRIHNIAIEQFNAKQKFDLIISNPPFFINDLKNKEEKKGIARHTNEQFFHDLVTKIVQLLTEKGSFWFILPIKQAELLINSAAEKSLYPTKIIMLHSDSGKPAFRCIVRLRAQEKSTEKSHFYIYESEKNYTAAYKVLLSDFFLPY